jgi:hypothetical protein
MAGAEPVAQRREVVDQLLCGLGTVANLGIGGEAAAWLSSQDCLGPPHQHLKVLVARDSLAACCQDHFCHSLGQVLARADNEGLVVGGERSVEPLERVVDRRPRRQLQAIRPLEEQRADGVRQDGGLDTHRTRSSHSIDGVISVVAQPRWA